MGEQESPDKPHPFRVRFRFDEVERGLHAEEAAILEDWLEKTRNLAAQRLAARIRTYVQTPDADPIELDPDELIALRDLLRDVDLGDYAGLVLLRQTLLGIDDPAARSGDRPAIRISPEALAGLDFAGQGIRFLIRDRDGKYSGPFDHVFRSGAVPGADGFRR